MNLNKKKKLVNIQTNKAKIHFFVGYKNGGKNGHVLFGEQKIKLLETEILLQYVVLSICRLEAHIYDLCKRSTQKTIFVLKYFLNSIFYFIISKTNNKTKTPAVFELHEANQSCNHVKLIYKQYSTPKILKASPIYPKVVFLLPMAKNMLVIFGK